MARFARSPSPFVWIKASTTSEMPSLPVIAALKIIQAMADKTRGYSNTTINPIIVVAIVLSSGLVRGAGRRREGAEGQYESAVGAIIPNGESNK